MTICFTVVVGHPLNFDASFAQNLLHLDVAIRALCFLRFLRLPELSLLLLLSSVGCSVEGVEHVEEDERLCDAQVFEDAGEAFLVIEEEAPVDAKDDKLS